MAVPRPWPTNLTSSGTALVNDIIVPLHSIAVSRVASEPCHGWQRSPRKGRRINQNHGLLRSCWFRVHWPRG